MQSIPNLLIIAGTGTKSGKTTMACRIIERFRSQGLIAIRVSPHFHTRTEGLLTFREGEGYHVSMESNATTTKDTSRMLRAGASKVYLIESGDELLQDVFLKLMANIPADTPVICESPALRNYFEPGLFILMGSTQDNKRQDLSYLQHLPHLEFNIIDLSRPEAIPIQFRDGRWGKRDEKLTQRKS